MALLHPGLTASKTELNELHFLVKYPSLSDLVTAIENGLITGRKTRLKICKQDFLCRNPEKKAKLLRSYNGHHHVSGSNTIKHCAKLLIYNISHGQTLLPHFMDSGRPSNRPKVTEHRWDPKSHALDHLNPGRSGAQLQTVSFTYYLRCGLYLRLSSQLREAERRLETVTFTHCFLVTGREALSKRPSAKHRPNLLILC